MKTPCPECRPCTAQGHTLFAFSNGVEATVRHLLDGARVLPLLDGVVSVDDLRTFKPNPTVYGYLVTRSQQAKTQTWVVSGNTFDVLGAKAAGPIEAKALGAGGYRHGAGAQ